MNSDDLTHPFSSAQMRAVNQQIADLFTADDVETSELLALVIQRDEFVQERLSNLAEPERKQFAEAELAINKCLQEAVARLVLDNQKVVGEQLKRRSAIRHYTR